MNRFVGCSEHAFTEIESLDLMYNILVCGGPDLVGWHLYPTERLVMFVMGMVGVFGMVIPKFRKRDGANRHFVTKRASLALLLHIGSGFISLLLSALMGIFGLVQKDSNWSTLALSALVFVDIIHEATIIRIVKNHDGIFPLRIGNFLGFYSKVTTIINIRRHYHNPYMTDLMFLHSNGFMGARLAAVLAAFYMYITRKGGGLYLEYHYSLGVSLTQFHIATRVPHGVSMWILLAPLVSYWYYHELWLRKYKRLFIVLNVVGSAIAFCSLTKRFQVLYMLAYYVACFLYTPMYYRIPDLTVAASNNFNDKKNSHSTLRSIFERTSVREDDDQESDFRMVLCASTLRKTLSEKDKKGFRFGNASVWIPVLDENKTT